jgi:hypothetical protein
MSFVGFSFLEDFYKRLDDNQVAVKKIEDSSTTILENSAFWSVNFSVMVLILSFISALVLAKLIKKVSENYKELD